jgi:anthranilate/para-aminobenzoate synthase component I
MPAVPEVLAPLAAAARLAGMRGRVVLCAGRDDDDLGGWSFVAAEPQATLIARGHSLVELDAAGRPARRFTADPLAAAEAFLAAHGCAIAPTPASPHPPGQAVGAPPSPLASLVDPPGGAAPEPRVIGYLGYELWRTQEAMPAGSSIGDDAPDLWLAAYGAIARWSAGATDLEIVGPDAGARTRLAEALARPAAPPTAPHLGALAPHDDASHHMARIERLLDHLTAGEVDRVHLARRLVSRITTSGDPLAILEALVEVAPAPHSALIEADGATLISGSAERFLASVDRIETEGRLGYADLLRATFPGASITGSPRPRAMQLIAELEPVRRGPHCGALGYFGAHGAFDLALAVQLGVISRGELRVHTGSSIVADSDAAAELAETERKVLGWHAAIERLRR